MKYDFSLPIISIFGEPLREGQDPASPLVSYRNAAITALLNFPTESPSEKMAVWDLACQIRDDPEECDLTSENVSLLKRALDKTYSAAVYGPFVRLLEGASTPRAVAAE